MGMPPAFWPSAFRPVRGLCAPVFGLAFLVFHRTLLVAFVHVVLHFIRHVLVLW